MSVIDLITELTKEDIRIWLEHGQLRFSAPASGLSEKHRDLLILHKPELIEFLSNVSRTNTGITTVDKDQLHSLSFAQERLWFTHQLQAKNPALHLSSTIKLTGELDIHSLEKALLQLIERHAILRTAYIKTAAGVLQHIKPNSPTLLIINTVNNKLSNEDITKAAQEQLSLDFNLADAENCKATLWIMPKQEHVLIFTVHHIASDAWSMGILAKELADFYWAFSQKTSLVVDALPIQYIDYAVSQRQHYAAHEHSKALEFWQHFLHEHENIQLPQRIQKNNAPSFKGATHNFIFPAELTHQLHDLSKSQSTTLYVTLLSLLSLLLYRHTQQQAFCIGTPISGRANIQTHSLVGCFLNILAIPMHLTNEKTINALIKSTHATFTRALEYQHTPFEEVVRVAAKRKDLNTSPLFQIMFGLQDAETNVASYPNTLTVEPLHIPKTASSYDINISAKEINHEIHVEIDYRTDIYHADTISELSKHWLQLCTQATNNPECTIGAINYLLESDISQLMAFGIGKKITRTETTLIQLFEQQSLTTPDEIAVIFDNTILRYQQLNEASNQLAHQLSASGINSSSRVGVLLDRSTNLIISLLAILKCGAAYIPLDTDFPIARIEFICTDANVDLLICDAIGMQHNVRCAVVDMHNNDQWSTHPTHNLSTTRQASSLFNIIYTSGSTGNPKGVATGHAAIVNRLLWMQDCFSITANDRILHKTPIMFDVSIWEIFLPLISGAKLVIAESGSHKVPHEIHQLINQQQITMTHFVPSMLSIYLHSINTPCHSLRLVFCSGESLDTSLAEDFFIHNPHCRLVNLYGPTEAAIDVSYFECKPKHGAIAIGKPIDNAELFILDSHQQLIPSGAKGELAIGGICLANAYINKPEQDKQKFIDHPTLKRRLYLTGDYAYWDTKGDLHFAGRQDEQIKIRGMRIELGEIESFIFQMPGMVHCKALAKQLTHQQHMIVIYYHSATAIDADNVRDYLSGLMPSMMMPNLFIEVKQWPLLANGKTDVKSLPGFIHPADAPHTITAATTDVEKKIAHIWMDVLSITEVDIHANFFELGGHSLLAIMALNRIQTEFGIKLDLGNIFYEPTIANFALTIEKTLSKQPGTASDHHQEDSHI